MPKSGIGSTLPASRNLREGLVKIVEYLKKKLDKEMISILGILVISIFYLLIDYYHQTHLVGT